MQHELDRLDAVAVVAMRHDQRAQPVTELELDTVGLANLIDALNAPCSCEGGYPKVRRRCRGKVVRFWRQDADPQAVPIKRLRLHATTSPR